MVSWYEEEAKRSASPKKDMSEGAECVEFHLKFIWRPDLHEHVT